MCIRDRTPVIAVISSRAPRWPCVSPTNLKTKLRLYVTDCGDYVLCAMTGEDRWLCTLLLQQGYKVEYCAAADASTYAPETFKEFYNQRRRWIPSTLANMMDLMSDYHRTVMVNDNISYLYMIYQAVVMGASMLAPATVVLMVAGAIHVVVGGGLYWLWLAMSMGAAVFYMFVCFR